MSVLFVLGVRQDKCTMCGNYFVYLQTNGFRKTCSHRCKRRRINRIHGDWRKANNARAKARQGRMR